MYFYMCGNNLWHALSLVSTLQKLFNFWAPIFGTNNAYAPIVFFIHNVVSICSKHLHHLHVHRCVYLFKAQNHFHV